MSATPRRLQLYLCHAEVDKPTVRQLYRQLENDGITAWFDEEDLEGGSERALAIGNAIEEADVILVCLSKQALATEGYLHKEIKLALDKADLQPEGTITILPLRLDDTPLPFHLKNRNLVSLDL